MTTVQLYTLTGIKLDFGKCKEPKGSFLLDKNTKLMYNGGTNYEKEK